MYDPQADLRTLYQAYSSQIEFSKSQLWRVVNYGIWVIAGIIGLSRGFHATQNWTYDWSQRWVTLFPVMIILVFFISLYNMAKAWNSMILARKKYIKISKQLSATFRRNVASPGRSYEDPYPCNYDCWRYDGWIVVPIMLVMFFGAIFAYIYLITHMEFTTKEFFSFSYWWIWLPSGVTFITCCCFFIYHFRTSKGVPHKQFAQKPKEFSMLRKIIHKFLFIVDILLAAFFLAFIVWIFLGGFIEDNDKFCSVILTILAITAASVLASMQIKILSAQARIQEEQTKIIREQNEVADTALIETLVSSLNQELSELRLQEKDILDTRRPEELSEHESSNKYAPIKYRQAQIVKHLSNLLRIRDIFINRAMDRQFNTLDPELKEQLQRERILREKELKRELERLSKIPSIDDV